ncbi:MAG: RHS repeat protein [Lachnospiraceae bacterium]|nr:RHS repeat protein [Lachnospiraceae bacterium]
MQSASPYDPAGNLLRAQTGDGKEVMTAVSYEYDALNRVPP